MKAITLSQQPPGRTGSALMEALPDPLPRPPGRPPGEPIIIKDPLRPPQMPEIDRPPDEEEEDDPEIKKPPGIVPEKPPPPAPWERADRLAVGVRLCLRATAGRP